MTKSGLRIAQAAAVLLAVGLAGWVVMQAHDRANPKDDGPTGTSTPASEGATEGTETPITIELPEDPGFLPTSKSGMPIPPTPKPEETEAEKAKKKKPAFLPSSKSIPIHESLPPVKKPDSGDGK